MDKIPTGYIVLNSQDEVIVNQVLQTLNNIQVPINTDTLMDLKSDNTEEHHRYYVRFLG